MRPFVSNVAEAQHRNNTILFDNNLRHVGLAWCIQDADRACLIDLNARSNAISAEAGSYAGVCFTRLA